MLSDKNPSRHYFSEKELNRKCEGCGCLIERKAQPNGKLEHPNNFLKRRFCSPTCRNKNAPRNWASGKDHHMCRPEADRFWEKVTLSLEENGCWTWNGVKTEFGYGRFYAETGSMPSHRWAYERAYGPIPDIAGLEMRHLCHNPPCVRLDHLTYGTHTQNMGDSVAANRVRYGSNHSHAKLD